MKRQDVARVGLQLMKDGSGHRLTAGAVVRLGYPRGTKIWKMDGHGPFMDEFPRKYGEFPYLCYFTGP